MSNVGEGSYRNTGLYFSELWFRMDNARRRVREKYGANTINPILVYDYMNGETRANTITAHWCQWWDRVGQNRLLDIMMTEGENLEMEQLEVEANNELSKAAR